MQTYIVPHISSSVIIVEMLSCRDIWIHFYDIQFRTVRQSDTADLVESTFLLLRQIDSSFLEQYPHNVDAVRYFV